MDALRSSNIDDAEDLEVSLEFALYESEQWSDCIRYNEERGLPVPDGWLRKKLSADEEAYCIELKLNL